MSAGIKANNDGSAAIQVGGTDYIQIGSTGNVTIPQSQTISGNLTVTGTITSPSIGGGYVLNSYVAPATWTKPTGLKSVKVTVVGGGGAAGSQFLNPATPSQSAGGGGGGGGGTAIYYAPAPSIPGPVAITAGPGTNSFGASASATAGSSGGSAAATASGAGGAGGAGSGGTVNITGGRGGPGAVTSPNSYVLNGSGGTSTMGGAGSAYGGGANAPGGGATSGIVIVEEFY